VEAGRATAQRRAEIVRLLAQEGSVQVVDLAARFGVSAPTIRRDLAWLVEQSLARRVRGGALAAGEIVPALGPPDAVHVRIGRAAGELVRGGETVFLGPGRLTLEVARALAGCERLTVVTNSLGVAREVAEHTSHTLILTGGQLERGNHGLGGRLAQAALESLRAGRVFLELSGVSAVEGLTDDNLTQAELARVLLGLGAQVTVLVAPERVGEVAAAYIGPAAEADVIVTAREVDSAPLWDLTESGVRVLLA
jgi:DeoR family transcriptional regulator of aga operon